MKVKKITVQNFKAISEQEVNFDGCSAIVTAGNNQGKSSLLRGLIDRLRGEKPNIILKDGEEKGFNILELTDGSRVEWKFTEKSESLAYITKDGIIQKTGVISAIGKKYFGVKFDIDTFLHSTPKKQVSILQGVVGLDFTEIDNRYYVAYDKRTIANNKLRDLRGELKEKPLEVEGVDLSKLVAQKDVLVKKFNDELDGIKKENNETRNKYNKEVSECREVFEKENDKNREEFESARNLLRNSIEAQNKENEILANNIRNLELEMKNIRNAVSSQLFTPFIDFDKMQEVINNCQRPEPYRIFEQEAETIVRKVAELEQVAVPIYQDERQDKTELVEIEKKITEAYNNNEAFTNYKRDMQEYNEWIAKGKEAKENADKTDKEVKGIETEKKEMIKTANIPSCFKIGENGILYNGYPLNDNQVSSSAKYIAGLKLGLLTLGDVRTMHFDASFLDKKSLDEVQVWASENDLQLLIERPDFDGGKIMYDIISK